MKVQTIFPFGFVRFLLSLLVISIASFSQATEIDDAHIEDFQKRYQLQNAFQKLVDNHGNGYENLYGVRNFRVVLNGVFYRGGANNVFHKINPRPNSNPLPEDGLDHLCQQGFTLAIYLYSTNFNTASKEKTCTTVTGEPNTLRYVQINPFDPKSLESILRYTHESLTSTYTGPIYSHCWNGWHASGLVAATSLRQFCGLNAKEAVAYWDKATDGVNQDAAYEKVRRQIREFVPLTDLQISPELQKKICPNTKTR